MKRKLEHLAAKLAFEELEPAQAEALRKNGVEDAEWQEKLGEYAELRSGLRRLGERTPECSVSAERLRDAILGEGLGHSRQSSRGWSWVWAPVATGVAAFALFSYIERRSTPSPVVRGLGDTPSYAAVSKLPSLPDAFTFNTPTAPPVESTPDTPTATPSSTTSRVKSAAKHGDRKAAMAQVMALKMISAMEAPAEAKPAIAPQTTKEAVSPKPASPDNDLHPSDAGKLVLIGTDTNGQTGAPSAQEVESVANVSIGG